MGRESEVQRKPLNPEEMNGRAGWIARREDLMMFKVGRLLLCKGPTNTNDVRLTLVFRCFYDNS